MRIALDTALTPAGVTLLTDGHDTWFDLSGLPRVDSQLVGLPARDVPALVERLCSICPVSHHLAGVAAYEALAGCSPLTPAATAVRRLLHHASVVDQLALRLAQVDASCVRPLRQLARAASTAAGSPGHFPATAVPGGVRTRPGADQLSDLSAQADAALEVAQHLVTCAYEAARQAPAREAREGSSAGTDAPLPRDSVQPGHWDGLDVCLIDEQGRPDLCGDYLRAVDAEGRVVVSAATARQWEHIVRESRPGQVAPRPLIRVTAPPAPGHGAAGQRPQAPTDGDWRAYRVGPLSQLRVGELSTPRAARRQEQWLSRWRDGRAEVVEARAIMALHAVEVIGRLASDPARFAGDLSSGSPCGELSPEGSGTGWVDSPRGLLVHSYRAGADGVVTAAQILTPTVQTEAWMAQCLSAVVTAAAGRGELAPMAPCGPTSDATRCLPLSGWVRERAEAAIQQADPCLPCVSAPPGTMRIDLRPTSPLAAVRG